MLTKLDMQFIEVAARVVLEHQPCRYCDVGHIGNSEGACRGGLHAPKCGFQACHDIAASLHGRLLERNGCKTVNEIVAAAREAWDREHSGQYTDDSRFFRAVAIEAMGGAKASETFAVFQVEPRRPPVGGTLHDSTFSVPSIVQEGQS